MKQRPILMQAKKARALTAEQAVSKILNTIYEWNGHTQWGYIRELALRVGMDIKVRGKGIKAKVTP